MTQFTPAMQQYVDIKKQYSDCILFFRLGDFYETFWEDAKICSKILEIVLTSKNKNSENPIPMAGIPYHSADKYITKLVKHGYKIAIAEQISQPIAGQIVQREVQEIITPGTYIQESKKDYTYMLAIFSSNIKSGLNYHVAWGDFSIGTYWTKSFKDLGKMQKFILNINPVEIIIDVDFAEKDELISIVSNYTESLISVFDVPYDIENYIANKCNVQTISSYGKALEEGRLNAFGLLINYLNNTQKKNLTNIVRVSFHNQENMILLDDITIKNLEIFTSSYENSEKYSLIGILDNTRTAGGSRLLRDFLKNPIHNLTDINYRLDNIQYYINHFEKTNQIHHILGNLSDIPKIITNIIYKKTGVKFFVKLRQTIAIIINDTQLLGEIKRLGLSDQHLNNVQNIYNLLIKVIKSDEEYNEDMNYINDGYNTHIDELRKLAYHSDDLLFQYQQELAQLTGITNVKIKYVMNQGYFIGITNKDIETFEKKLSGGLNNQNIEGNNNKFDLIRRNTLKGEQRYTSEYLNNLEGQIIQAKDKLSKLEIECLEHIKAEIIQNSIFLHTFADTIYLLDVFTSQAIQAKSKNYNRPNFHNGKTVEIIGGRHPVIEKYLPIDQPFVANNLNISNESDKQDELGFIHIITGPNMGGKSTFLRQNAIIVLMAHCGLYLPVQKANICLVDGIFARVGSGDIIAKNQSTFMTEMIEVANILNNASEKSFVIFDELGRGTSTYDGLALTKAILEYISHNIQCKSLIATHYHELIDLQNNLLGVQNFSVSVYETHREVVFMKKIIKGGASKSYGLDVATLAGIPSSIIDRARDNLQALEQKNINNTSNNKGIGSGFRSPSLPLGAFSTRVDPKFELIKNIVKGFDIDNITPLQAMDILNKIKEELGRG